MFGLTAVHIRHLLLVVGICGTAATPAFTHDRLEDKVDVGPVQAELGSMAAVDFNLAIGDDLFDKTGKLLDYYCLDRIHLVHYALHALLEQEHLVMQLVVNLLRVSRRLFDAPDRALFTVHIFQVNQQVVELGLYLCHLLLRRTLHLVVIHFLFENLRLLNLFIVCLSYRVLIIYERLLTFFSEIDLLRELLVRIGHLVQLTFQLSQQSMARLIITNLIAQLFNELKTLIKGRVILLGYIIHLRLELAEVFVVARGLPVILVDTCCMLMLLQLTFLFGLANSLFLSIDLVSEHLIAVVLHLEDEVELRPFRIKCLAQLHWHLQDMRLLGGHVPSGCSSLEAWYLWLGRLDQHPMLLLLLLLLELSRVGLLLVHRHVIFWLALPSHKI